MTDIIALCHTPRTSKPVARIVLKVIDGVEQVVLDKPLRDKYMLRSPRAICFDVEILQQAQLHGVTVIIARNLDSHFTYQISFKNFMLSSFPIDRGYGEQLGSEVSNWKAKSEPRKIEHCAKRDVEVTPQEPAIIQPTLFDIEQRQK